jgi:hypothetical protein
MGRGMLQDKETIASSKIPSFPTYPTPVNVSVARLPSTISVVKSEFPIGYKMSLVHSLMVYC